MRRYIVLLILCGAFGNLLSAGIAERSPPADGHYQRGLDYLKAARYRAAITAFTEAHRAQKASVDTAWFAELHYRTASAYHALEEFDQAATEYKKAIGFNPEAFHAHHQLGVAYSELKQYQAALDAYHKAVHIAPDASEPHYNIGLVYLKQGKLPAAIKAFETAIALAPKGLSLQNAYTGLGETYLKQGALPQAADAYTEATRLNANATSALLGLGKVHAKQGNLPLAISTFEKVIELQADNTEAHYHIAQAWIKQGKTEQAGAAMKFFKVLRQTDPLLAEAEKWVKIHPEDPKGYNNLGIVYLARHRFAEAVKNYKRAIALAPNLATAHYNLGHAYQKQEHLQLAIDAYGQAISADETLAIAHNNIAICFVDLQAQLDKALRHAQTAVRLAPSERNYWDTLAQVYTQLGLESEAQHARKKATQP